MYLKQLLSMGLVLSLALVGCDDTSSSENNPDKANNTNNANNANNIVDGVQLLPSARPRVRFKGGDRWANQLSRGLGIERDALCKEFGLYDCISAVHFISLGGVEPYRMRIDEPLPKPPVSAPIAVERISLSACSLRAETDLAAEADDRVIFKELTADKPSDEDVSAMGQRLYRNLMSRDALATELEELGGFWAELEEEEGVENLAEEWATLSCFAVASSTEMLFY